MKKGLEGEKWKWSSKPSPSGKSMQVMSVRWSRQSTSAVFVYCVNGLSSRNNDSNGVCLKYSENRKHSKIMKQSYHSICTHIQ